MSSPPTGKAIRQLLLPPGPSARSVYITPEGQVAHSESIDAFQSIPQLFVDALAVRAAVFVIEQQCSASEEVDADDAISWHWVIYGEDQDTLKDPVATIRLVPAQAHPDADDKKAVEGPNYGGSILWDHEEPYVKIGRLATAKEARGRGYGKVLVREALSYAGNNRGDMVKDQMLGQWKGLVLAHAQRDVEGWYKSLGFEKDDGMGVWWEEGIEHVGMWKRVEVRRLESRKQARSMVQVPQTIEFGR